MIQGDQVLRSFQVLQRFQVNPEVQRDRERLRGQAYQLNQAFQWFQEIRHCQPCRLHQRYLGDLQGLLGQLGLVCLLDPGHQVRQGPQGDRRGLVSQGPLVASHKELDITQLD